MDFEQLCSFEVLYAAYKTARQGKREKQGAAQYEANALACTARLSRLLLSGAYKPGKFEVFTVYEPKERLVQAPAFVDKVVQHAIVDNVLYDAITRSFIQDRSPPARGAWIEIIPTQSIASYVMSPPARGAWIEIQSGSLLSRVMSVAPRTGGVD